MEDIQKQGEHGLLKIKILIEELRDKGADKEKCDELEKECEKSVEDIVRLIESSAKERLVVIREFARFVEIPWEENDSSRYARVVAIKIGFGDMKGKYRGVYQINWNLKHYMNITGECMAANVNKENTMISAMIALITAAEAMGIKWLAVHMGDQDMYRCLKEGDYPPEKFSQHLIDEVRRIQGRSKTTWKMITESFMERIESQYGKIKHQGQIEVKIWKKESGGK